MGFSKIAGPQSQLRYRLAADVKRWLITDSFDVCLAPLRRGFSFLLSPSCNQREVQPRIGDLGYLPFKKIIVWLAKRRRKCFQPIVRSMLESTLHVLARRDVLTAVAVGSGFPAYA